MARNRNGLADDGLVSASSAIGLARPRGERRHSAPVKRIHPLAPCVPRAVILSFRLLGPFEVVVDEHPIVLQRRNQRTLLALLLARAGEFVSIDWLMDELWAGQPPHTARASLQNGVCQLRKALGPAALLTGDESYALTVALDQVDSEQFRLAVSEARVAASAEVRARMLRDALGLWRGPAFADISKTPWLAFEASLLNELRISTIEYAIEAELEIGCDAELVPELERLIAEDPYRERLRAQLMLALYRAGRQPKALEVFKETRETLRSELGLEPSPPLRELERGILTHDPALAACPHPAAPGRRANKLLEPAR